ncbi:hypothetical protein [Gemmatimonas sp.]|uniref:hypothetical protein n=1 Tax=Gemmatimonas sp. TaxID=1962908 RepID=UPI0027BB10B5|nr:hypothetical protein [Gemmatimonas sp.]
MTAAPEFSGPELRAALDAARLVFSTPDGAVEVALEHADAGAPASNTHRPHA